MRENHEKEMKVMDKRYQKLQVTHDRLLVTKDHIDLINTFDRITHEIQRLKDQYVAGIREYNYVKEIDNKWFGSLSGEERARMYDLEELLGTDEVIDVHLAITIVRQRFEKIEKFVASELEELEDALDKANIDKMKELQNDINKEQLYARLQDEVGKIKAEVRSKSHALQNPGVMSQITSRIYQSLIIIISKIMT